MGKDSTKDKIEGALDKTKGQAKETVGFLTGSNAIKAAGQADKVKGTLKMKGAAKDLLH